MKKIIELIKKNYVISAGVLLLICSMVAISYAVWRIFLVQNNLNKIVFF